MSDTQHTPGPWVRHERNGSMDAQGLPADDIYSEARSFRMQRIAEVDETATEHMANARLIAAAPDLLAALEQAHAALALRDALNASTLMDEAQRTARAAIARATNG